MNEFTCPNCGFEPPEFTGTFYRVEKGEVIEDLSDWDLEETKLPQPDNYYPKFLNRQHTNIGGFYGFEWDEIHFCPNCNEEFTFDNCSI